MSNQEASHAIWSSYVARGAWRLFGCNAELLSVLEGTEIWNRVFSTPTLIDDVYHALDTGSPSEERVVPAMRLIDHIKRVSLLSCWIPRYSQLAEHEFGGEFFDGYRDHSIHTLSCFLLGLYLYQTVRPLKDALDAQLLPDLQPTDAFLEWWTLAVLWHDCGYPFEAASVISSHDALLRQMAKISEHLNNHRYHEGLKRSGMVDSPQTLRAVYRAGRHFPEPISQLSELWDHPYAVQVIDPLLRKIGFGINAERPLREFDRLSTQCAVGRPPYHDHGLAGAALLAVTHAECQAFLDNLVEGGLRNSADPVLQRLDPAVTDVWVRFDERRGLVTRAIEAIAFHNLNTETLHHEEARRLMPVGRTEIGYRDDAHLFFLGLVDTLQDWDRHHFVEDTPEGRFRKSTRSDSLLIQGDGTFVRLATPSRTDVAASVRKLFKGWLNAGDVDELLKDKAIFSRPERVLAGSPQTLHQASESAKERDRLIAQILPTVGGARQILATGGPNAVLSASSRIRGLLQKLDLIKSVLTPTDEHAVRAAIDTGGLHMVESLAFTMIEPGARLEHGVVREKLGEGGFGKVFRVEEETRQQERQLAFKLFHSYDLEHVDKRRLFERGYKAMERLCVVPNIVSVVYYSEIPLGFYMDYVAGPNLKDGLCYFKTIHERLELARTIASTLASAHELGVLHRDVKPTNVLLDSLRGNEPVLTDFDLAWIDGRTQQTQAMFATLAYGAPEQHQLKLGKWTRKATVDVYGFGALMYFILMGQDPPLHGIWKTEYWDRLQAVLVGSLPAGAALRVLSLVQSCVETLPERRTQTMEEVVRRLGECIQSGLTKGHNLSFDDWIKEVRFRYSERIESSAPEAQFYSITGALSWRLSTGGESRRLDAICSLLREPRFEGVNYEGYRLRIVRQVDTRVQEFSIGGALKAERHGALYGAGSAMTIRISGFDLSIADADSVASLLRSIGRAVE